ncbi:hypothetical protein GCM10009555_047020 [Acrocarpospora macrocephala]|uniref:Uncharacterized protein n=1 Tax=Acrocarpospora macrocephala TaxID=150177 RepID=A0A5M3WT31_9ACTN|nr:hypothetical protein Amac_056410 [Acrocarpospora macrocephala]
MDEALARRDVRAAGIVRMTLDELMEDDESTVTMLARDFGEWTGLFEVFAGEFPDQAALARMARDTAVVVVLSNPNGVDYFVYAENGDVVVAFDPVEPDRLFRRNLLARMGEVGIDPGREPGGPGRVAGVVADRSRPDL